MKKLLDYACQQYYEGKPIMSDAAFDLLADQYDYDPVGYAQGIDSIEHPYRMYSLQKVYEGENSIELEAPVVVTPKLDGAAVSLIYIDGKLSLGLSRGDGIKGKDITRNIKKRVPSTIDTPRLMQITGEVVAPKTIENARNYAAGALNLKTPEDRDITFIAYDIQPYGLTRSWVSDMEVLKKWGFNTVIQSNWDKFPHDGLVFRMDDSEAYQLMGYTSKHPRGAYALKTRKEGVETTLLDVVWQVGKSGVVSPVAILEKVNIDGAYISRATLHNPKYIEDLDLEIGCRVEVIRSGEIIPRVVRRV